MRKLAFVLSLVLLLSNYCFAAWVPTEPADSTTWNLAAAFIRGNWVALGGTTGTDVTEFGAVGTGSADDRAAIVLAIAEGVNPVIFPAGTYRIDSSLTIDESVILQFMPGAKLNPIAGVTITMNGQVIAGNYQIFSHTSTGKVVFKDQMTINIVWYSTSGDGSTGSKWAGGLAIATAVNAEFHTYYLPGGFYLDTSTVTIDNAGSFDIVGDGHQTTKVLYTVADNSSCWKFTNSTGGGARINRINVRDIWFHGVSTATGAAIEVEFLAKASFERLIFQDFNAGTSNSKAFWCKGLETITFRKIHVNDCTIGFHIAGNSVAGEDGDAIDVHWEDIYVIGDDTANSYAWKIDADGQIQGIKIDGASNVALCKYGVYYSEAVNTTALHNFEVSNLRFEQGAGAGVGWAIYFNPNANFRGVIFRNVKVGSANGFYARNTQGILFEGCVHVDATGTSFDIDTKDSNFPVIFINCLRDLDTTFKIVPDLLFSTGNKNGLDSFSIYGSRDTIETAGTVRNIVTYKGDVVTYKGDVVTY